MKEQKKLLIAIGVVLGLCCCLAGGSVFGFREFGKRMGNAISTEPAVVEEAQQNIAEFDVPAGYTPTVMSFLGYTILNYIPTENDSDMTIMLMQYASLFAGDPEQMREQLRQAARQQSNQPGMAMKLVETREVVMRGETVLVTISESAYQNITIRQWMTVFTGNQGPALLMIQGSADKWDEQLIEDLVESFR